MLRDIRRNVDDGLARDRLALFNLADQLVASSPGRTRVIDAYGGMAVDAFLQEAFNNLGLFSNHQPAHLPIVNNAKSLSPGYRERMTHRLARAGLVGQGVLIVTEYNAWGRAVGRLIEGLRSVGVAHIDIATLGQSPHDKDDRLSLPEVGDIYIGYSDDDMPALAEGFFSTNFGRVALRPDEASAHQREVWQYTEAALHDMARQYAVEHTQSPTP